MEDVLDLLDVAAKRYPIKALAPLLSKGESTLRNELTAQNGYKLGLFDAVMLMKLTGDHSALYKINAFLGHASYRLPPVGLCALGELTEQAGKLAKEFGEAMTVFGKAMADGELTPEELSDTLKELEEMNRQGLYLQAVLEACRRRA